MSDSKASTMAQRWAELCDNISRAGVEILASAEGLDPVNQAEGLRYLTRLLRGSFEKYIEFSDPLDPVIFKMCDERTGYGGDNPDNVYSASPVSDREIYEITGNKGTIWHFNFNVFNWQPDGKYELLAIKNGRDIVCDADGNFSVVIGGAPQEGNWIPLPAGANQILMRQSFRDRRNEQEVKAKIRLLSGNAKIAPLLPSALLVKLDGAEAFFCKTGRLMHEWSNDFLASCNQLPLTPPEFIARGGGDPNACFYMSSWKIGAGEALLVHIPEFAEDKLWSLALFNFWLESMDYTNFHIHTNSAIAQRNADGSFTIVIANRDPGVANWLNATGHVQGNMIRRAWTGGVPIANVQTEIVQLDDVDWAKKLRKW
jgi:hypothetical protein